MPKHALYAPLDELLQRPLSECVPSDRQLKFVHASSTVEETFKTLGDNRILSAPVVSASKTGAVQWLGFVSYLDLIRYFGQTVEKETFLTDTINNVLKFSRSSPLQVEERSRIIDAVEFFGSLGRIHRCGVTRSSGDAVQRSQCSQSDIVRYVAKHVFDSPDLIRFSSVRIGDLGWGKRHPITIKDTDTVHDAINTLIQKNVSCLGVVDANGTLKGNFSPSDLRGLGGALLEHLKRPVLEFLSSQSPASLEPCSEAVTQSIGVLLARLEEKRLHHLWIQDVNGKPEGLVTLTDIMNLLMKFDESMLPPPPEAEAQS